VLMQLSLDVVGIARGNPSDSNADERSTVCGSHSTPWELTEPRGNLTFSSILFSSFPILLLNFLPGLFFSFRFHNIHAATASAGRSL